MGIIDHTAMGGNAGWVAVLIMAACCTGELHRPVELQGSGLVEEMPIISLVEVSAGNPQQDAQNAVQEAQKTSAEAAQAEKDAATSAAQAKQNVQELKAKEENVKEMEQNAKSEADDARNDLKQADKDAADAKKDANKAEVQAESAKAKANQAKSVAAVEGAKAGGVGKDTTAKRAELDSPNKRLKELQGEHQSKCNKLNAQMAATKRQRNALAKELGV